MSVDLHELDAWIRVVDEPMPGWFARRVYHGGPVIPARIWHTPCWCVGDKLGNLKPGHVYGMPGCVGSDVPLQVQVMDFPPSTHTQAVYSVWNGWHPIRYETYLAIMEERAWDGAQEDPCK